MLSAYIFVDDSRQHFIVLAESLQQAEEKFHRNLGWPVSDITTVYVHKTEIGA
jgi:hypothetical protein